MGVKKKHRGRGVGSVEAPCVRAEMPASFLDRFSRHFHRSLLL